MTKGRKNNKKKERICDVPNQHVEGQTLAGGKKTCHLGKGKKEEKKMEKERKGEENPERACEKGIQDGIIIRNKKAELR